MIRSMTGFARQEYQETWGQVCWELRSVNHRYLDISVRLPEELRNLEVFIRERVQNVIKRGKVDCVLYFQANNGSDVHLQVNVALAQQVWEAIRAIDVITGNTNPPHSLDILRWSGVLSTQTLDKEHMSEILLGHFDNALSQFIAYREREGAQLTTLIEQRCVAIAAEVKQIRSELPIVLQNLRERLRVKVAELVEADSERLEQEIVLLAQKMDISEELDRLESHLNEIRKTLMQNQAVGRRLDFLAQELHREANTLGAKSANVNTSRSAIELKVLIEQMREQVQNIE